ncbi:MAG TPA: DUF1289 domain-containing protein [Burkholderiales bacterium]|nr:DUF1289 domain-containing protein [Burkholderiales bacterium]
MDLRRARARALVQGQQGLETLKSPCIKVCQMDPRHGLCLGCGRTLDEIARWATMKDAEREAILLRLHERKTLAGNIDCAPRKPAG